MYNVIVGEHCILVSTNIVINIFVDRIGYDRIGLDRISMQGVGPFLCITVMKNVGNRDYCQ